MFVSQPDQRLSMERLRDINPIVLPTFRGRAFIAMSEESICALSKFLELNYRAFDGQVINLSDDA